jgi:tRNA1(Val) A37 N6-methylase TrmN6
METTDDALLGGKVMLRQPARGHRAGTDAVLLAAASRAEPGEVLMDIGAATGAVGLMVASRLPGLRLVFVERDAALADLCRHNCEINAVPARVAIADVLDKASRQRAELGPESADVVVTNPPFLQDGEARLSPDARRAAAHALPAGGLEAWLRACLGLMKPKGRLVLIHRADRLGDCLSALSGRLGAIDLRMVHPTADQPAIRFLLTGTKGSRGPLTIAAPLILNTAEGRFTPQSEALHRGEAALA